MQDRYLKLLSEKYPAPQAVCREIINLTAILNLPKGTEHFMSDIHGEYEAFLHILNNCSGVIREKVESMFGERLSPSEMREICTLIYYPREKLRLLRHAGRLNDEWFRLTLGELIEIARMLSSKYTRSKVRKELPKDFSYIIDELLHMQTDEDDNQIRYHQKIIDTILRINNAQEFIIALSALIKSLAVDHLHIVGDIFDRGVGADKIMDLLLQYHSVDVEWGNHDILWMGAVAGSETCVAHVVRNSIRYDNMESLENGYGISLRTLTLFAEKTYPDLSPMDAADYAISVILFKLEGQTILRHPEYGMEDRLLMDKIDPEHGTVKIADKTYTLRHNFFPTLDVHSPFSLTEGENAVLTELCAAFSGGERLHRHIEFLYEHGGMYKIYNGNLLYHGCVPLDGEGNMKGVRVENGIYLGRTLFDKADEIARRAFFKRKQDDLDFMWYLWCGENSPLSGRCVKTFERTFIADESAWEEEVNPYYSFYHDERVCNMILREFGLYSEHSHIVNGHTPIRAGEGESPLRGNGKLIVIDGGFCRAYHKKTGIAGYTLIYNSHGLRLKAHQPFESVNRALQENKDIESVSSTVETESKRLLVSDTDKGHEIEEEIKDLERLLAYYRKE